MPIADLGGLAVPLPTDPDSCSANGGADPVSESGPLRGLRAGRLLVGATTEVVGADLLLVRKLAAFAELTEADRAALTRACGRPRGIAGQTELLRQGTLPDSVHVVLRGFACRLRQRQGGACQILAYLLPGDVCDPDFAFAQPIDHVLSTLSACTVARIPRDTFLALLDRHPNIDRALRLSKLVDVAIAREWLVSLGRRSARERLAHLFCELLVRLQAVGLASANRYELPLTQVNLSDTLALTSVHVNRTLREMRREGLVELKGRRFVIRDVERLAAVAEFNDAYLKPVSTASGLHAPD